MNGYLSVVVFAADPPYARSDTNRTQALNSAILHLLSCFKGQSGKTLQASHQEELKFTRLLCSPHLDILYFRLFLVFLL